MHSAGMPKPMCHHNLAPTRNGITVPFKCSATYVNIILLFLLQAWQLKLVPLEDAPTKGSDKSGAKPSPAPQIPAREYGCDLPFKQPAANRTADDVVLALCAGPGANGAAPADNRSHPPTHLCIQWCFTC